VSGLTADDFLVLDNVVRQEVELVDVSAVPLSVLVILDTSGSVYGEKLEHLRSAAHAFVEALEEKDEASLLTFAHMLVVRQEFTNDLAEVHRAIEGPIQGGETSVKDAFYAGLKLVEARFGRPLILIFTDGLDNSSWLTEAEVLEATRGSESVVYAVGVKARLNNNWINSGRWRKRLDGQADEFLKSITSRTGGTVSYASSTAELESLFLGVLDEMKNRYLLSFQVEGALERGWHKLDVKLTRGRTDEVRARAGYFVAAERN
jgi:VWFA-related protein